MQPEESLSSAQSESHLKIGINELIGHVNSAEFPEDLPIQKVAHTLTPQQRTYVALRVRGFSSAAACRKMNINQLAAQRWSHSDWFESACEVERIKWLTSQGIDKQEVLAPLVNTAVKVLHQTMHSEDEKLRWNAANRVIEIFFEDKKPVGRPRTPEEINDAADKALMDLSDIQQRANERVNQLKSGTPPSYDLRANA
jgi:hypothetical protein